MSRKKRDFVVVTDLTAAVGLLSRLPVPVDAAAAQARGAGSAWAWPLAGALIGALAALTGSVALWLGLPGGMAAGLALACLVVTTGALHEDGLADCADGFWGGWEPARRLEIMQDSRIGAYGVIALTLALILRWQAIAVIAEAGMIWPALIAAGALSRAPMVAMMAWMVPARSGGLSRAVGRPTARTAAAAALAALAVGGLSLGLTILPATVAVALSGLGWAAVCRAKIGGQTGDTLGALQQITEIGVMLVIVASLG